MHGPQEVPGGAFIAWITDPQGATFTASKFVPENKDLVPKADTAVGMS